MWGFGLYVTYLISPVSGSTTGICVVPLAVWSSKSSLNYLPLPPSYAVPVVSPSTRLENPIATNTLPDHLNCAANVVDYTPLSMKDIINSGVLKNIKSIHRYTIDKASEKKKQRDQNSD